MLGRDFHEMQEEMPHVAWGEEAVTPTPEALAPLGQEETNEGRAVFAPLPPGTRELPIASLVSHFEGATRTRLLAHVETKGSPGDSVTGDCVVLDSLQRAVARASQSLTESACDPAEHRVGEFAFELDPGRYQLALAVHDMRNGRGVARTWEEVGAVSSALSLSDVILQCGPIDLATSHGAIRLNPNFPARVEDGRPLFAYFEIYHLLLDAHGGNRFEYEYSIRGLPADGRPPKRQKRSPAEAASRLAYRSVQEGVGAMRRQFINVPAGSLPPGRYRLEIIVRDVLAGTSAEHSADFVRAGKGER